MDSSSNAIVARDDGAARRRRRDHYVVRPPCARACQPRTMHSRALMRVGSTKASMTTCHGRGASPAFEWQNLTLLAKSSATPSHSGSQTTYRVMPRMSTRMHGCLFEFKTARTAPAAMTIGPCQRVQLLPASAREARRTLSTVSQTGSGRPQTGRQADCSLTGRHAVALFRERQPRVGSRGIRKNTSPNTNLVKLHNNPRSEAPCHRHSFGCTTFKGCFPSTWPINGGWIE